MSPNLIEIHQYRAAHFLMLSVYSGKLADVTTRLQFAKLVYDYICEDPPDTLWVKDVMSVDVSKVSAFIGALELMLTWPTREDQRSRILNAISAATALFLWIEFDAPE